MWLQSKRETAIERNRSSSFRRDDAHEFKIGRLKHERVRVPRGEAVSIYTRLSFSLDDNANIRFQSILVVTAKIVASQPNAFATLNVFFFFFWMGGGGRPVAMQRF